MEKKAMALLLVQILFQTLVNGAVSGWGAKPGCPDHCGDVHLPFPFGLSDECSRDGFVVNCTMTADGSYKPFIDVFEIISISLPTAKARMKSPISWQCYNSTQKKVVSYAWDVDIAPYNMYRPSYTDNKFVVLGCKALAYVQGTTEGTTENNTYISGCGSICDPMETLANGSCSGIGCCKTSIPQGVSLFKIFFDSNYNTSDIWQKNPCNYAFLVEDEWFSFSTSYITSNVFNHTNDGWVPGIVDWAVGNETCDVAEKNKSSYACVSENSECFNSLNGPGYFCNCSSGYKGNPYLHDGCQDINECLDKDHPPCSGSCVNTIGSYDCLCPTGTSGNPYINGTCLPPANHQFGAGVLVATISGGTVLVLFICFSIFITYHRRRLKKLKQKYYNQHGGLLLDERIKSNQGLALKIFTIEEMEYATNKFDKERILGGGGQGTVYKGILKDNNVIAIKRSKIFGERQKKDFGKEMIVLSQINHKNIVKLLGCCLEVEVPMLVYEYIPNGTLYNLIHGKGDKGPLLLHTRLRIALECAEALAYLHSAASPPILHGDVKSSNILLDENYSAKVSDFGASVLVANNEIQFVTIVQGTCGYLDPEYLHTCQLTDKSDVYSFGVVILELFTGRKVLHFEGSEEERSLASSFVLAMKEDRLLEILDNEINRETDLKLIQEVAELAKLCLNLKGEDRPTMKEVVQELQRIIKSNQHLLIKQYPEEIRILVGQSSRVHEKNGTGFYSLQESLLSLQFGR